MAVPYLHRCPGPAAGHHDQRDAHGPSEGSREAQTECHGLPLRGGLHGPGQHGHRTPTTGAPSGSLWWSRPARKTCVRAAFLHLPHGGRPHAGRPLRQPPARGARDPLRPVRRLRHVPGPARAGPGPGHARFGSGASACPPWCPCAAAWPTVQRTTRPGHQLRLLHQLLRLSGLPAHGGLPLPPAQPPPGALAHRAGGRGHLPAPRLLRRPQH